MNWLRWLRISATRTASAASLRQRLPRWWHDSEPAVGDTSVASTGCAFWDASQPSLAVSRSPITWQRPKAARQGGRSLVDGQPRLNDSSRGWPVAAASSTSCGARSRRIFSDASTAWTRTRVVVRVGASASPRHTVGPRRHAAAHLAQCRLPASWPGGSGARQLAQRVASVREASSFAGQAAFWQPPPANMPLAQLAQ